MLTLSLRRLAAAIALPFVVLAGAPRAGSAQNATTGEVKAAFLYNFARFTEWPRDAFESDAAPLVIGVAGDERLRQTLDTVIRGKVAGNRPLTTRRVKDANDASAIHVLYVGGTAASRAGEFVEAVNGGAVLTVGDVARFCENGGMINFLVVDNRVRFEISVVATEQSGLKVSSRVLTLAKTIHGKS